MFQDVGHSAGVLGNGQEGHQEGVMIVIRCQMEVLRSGPSVTIRLYGQVEGWDPFFPQQLEFRYGH
jgi:hypothetical protein